MRWAGWTALGRVAGRWPFAEAVARGVGSQIWSVDPAIGMPCCSHIHGKLTAFFNLNHRTKQGVLIELNQLNDLTCATPAGLYW